MTKSERALLDLLKGLGVTVPDPKQAAASPAPAWVAEARAAVKAPEPDRVWTLMGVGRAKSGRDTTIYQTKMANGLPFQAILPGDLVRAIEGRKVVKGQ